MCRRHHVDVILRWPRGARPSKDADGFGRRDRRFMRQVPNAHVEAKTRNSFKVAQAAPKSLSILTTTTPGEQDARAQCKAAVPPAATP